MAELAIIGAYLVALSFFAMPIVVLVTIAIDKKNRSTKRCLLAETGLIFAHWMALYITDPV